MRVSLASLATAVAEERGISTISSIGLEDFEVVGMSMNGSAGELCKKRSARPDLAHLKPQGTNSYNSRCGQRCT